MLERDQKYVALFIDWDNLVISTAADLGGAIPDVKRIVHKAQQYGIVILAKAYAEWTSTSDKLMVYRAGVEPVYAPTFRFEAEATTRGKSLADPCLVADIVDSFHLLPYVGTYVIVTGDKDLIPVVRLAQLRGKHVVVIGPDLVAGVLRDMADDFVSYRKLVEDTLKPAAEPTRRFGVGEHGVTETVGQRPSGRIAGESSRGRRGRSETRAREEERPAATVVTRREPEAEVAPVPEAPAATKPAPVKEAPAPAEKTPAPDLSTVFTNISELLQQRYTEGKPRVRATNLKDSLMQRIPGFSERRYGFSKFKDLLTAAEQSGVVKVRVAGPVHWVSLPDRTEEAAPVEAAEPTPETIQEEAERIDRTQIPEMVQFVQNLRERSRWLTYTYLLTNLISHYAKTLPQAVAETRARAMLNCLVQEGILRIDKEPQEVDVAGAKHRVRMCHLEEANAVVADILARRAEEQRAESEAAAAEEAVQPEQPEAPAEIPQQAPVAEQREEVAEPKEEEPVEAPAEEAPSVTEEAPAPEEVTEPSQPEPITVETPAVAKAPEANGAERRAGRTREEAARRADPTPVFEVLANLVRENTGPKRPRMGAAGLKIRLTKALGTFDEHDYGFSRFKDFLKAAEDQGYVNLETSGQITWVLPTSAGEEAGRAADESSQESHTYAESE